MTVRELINSLQDMVDWDPEVGDSPVVKELDDTCRGFYFDILTPYASRLTKVRESYHDYTAIPRSEEPMLVGVIL